MIVLLLLFVFMMGTVNVCSAESEAGTETEVETETEQQAEDGKGETAPGAKAGGFTYIHDPRDNPKAMEDIVENPDAIYGFSPSPDSKRLKSYSQFDWTDPKYVADARKTRRNYHKSKVLLLEILYRMRDEGASLEEMARAVSKERNRLRLDAYKDDPKGLAAVKKSNLEAYGHEDGPTPDEMYEEYGSWTEVLRRAFGINMGMDACCGLYDEYYWLYEELGYVECGGSESESGCDRLSEANHSFI